MLKLKQIEITAFRSFDSTITLPINKLGESGLVFVEGENKVEPELGGNGSGKSSLWSALTWVLFGKTETNLKGDTIKNWHSKQQCAVKLTFELEGVAYVLERTHKPNKLTVNDEVVNQEALEDLLNIDFQSFLYSVYISQFGSKFLDLTPSVQMEVFTSILGKELDKWLEYSDAAGIKFNQLKDKKIELNQKIAKYEGVIETINIAKIDTKIKEFEDEKKVTVNELKSHLSETRTSGDTFKAESKLLKSKLAETIKKQAKVSEELSSNDVKLDLLNKESLKIHESEIKVGGELDYTQLEKARLEPLLNRPVCPTCGQSLKAIDSTIKKTVEGLTTKISDLKIKVTKLVTAKKALRDRITDVTTIRGKNFQEVRELTSEENLLKNKITSIEQKEKNTDAVIKGLVERIAKERSKENPFTKMLSEAKTNLATHKRLKEYTEQELSGVDNEQTVVEYWKKGFKNIRLMVLDESLKELEIHINNNLQTLGMADWSITLDIESETQRGSLRREFTVMVASPFGGGKVPIEVWSGGEGQRLRLAGTLGLMDFIHNRRGTDWNIEVFDEPSQFLSDLGIESLINTLHVRSRRLKKLVAFVDHRNLEVSGKFSYGIKVTKDAKGSSLAIQKM